MVFSLLWFGGYFIISYVSYSNENAPIIPPTVEPVSIKRDSYIKNNIKPPPPSVLLVGKKVFGKASIVKIPAIPPVNPPFHIPSHVLLLPLNEISLISLYKIITFSVLELTEKLESEIGVNLSQSKKSYSSFFFSCKPDL